MGEPIYLFFTYNMMLSDEIYLILIDLVRMLISQT